MIHKSIDLTNIKRKELQTPYEFQGISPTGASFFMNNQYFMRNEEPWFPIMGEFHYSRYPEGGWEEELLKMKSGGIQIVATYIFWIHHEEAEGEFNWLGQRNLSKFVQLCAKHGLLVWLRVGPWAHGECRNGGFPDWVENGGFETRIDSQPYLTYVERFFQEIHHQVEGMMFKDGGVVIGIQLENEYGHCGGTGGEKGEQHIRTLKQLCLTIGLVTPFYTTTAWGNAVVVEGETIPVFGGYVEAPWDQHIHEQPANEGYLFHGPMSETNIGTDLSKSDSHGFSFSMDTYPFLTAELGGGIQVTQHRRPYITGDEIEAFILSKLASGVTMIGYYMYHGGTNPKGKLSTLQESRATGMYNDLPELSYDFQAPLGEYGQMSSTYHKLKRLHLFVQDFGRELAVSQVCFPKDLPQDAEDMESLRYSVRYGNMGGFLFLNNFQRRREMSYKEDIHITIETSEGTVQFPSFNLENESRWIFPFNISLGKVYLKWATAQLLCNIKGDAADTYIFFGNKAQGAKLCLFRSNILSIEAKGAKITETESEYYISVETPSKDVYIILNLQDGSRITLLVLNQLEAEQGSKVIMNGQEYLMLSDADLYGRENDVRLCSEKASAFLSVYPTPVDDQGINMEGITSYDSIGLFSNNHIQFRPVGDEEIDLLKGSNRLESLENGGIALEFDLPPDLNENKVQWILKIGFAGDKARLWINGQLEADWFYIGDEWEVVIGDFLSLERPLSLRLEIDPLHIDGYVYLDKRPEFKDGVCCRLDRLTIVPSTIRDLVNRQRQTEGQVSCLFFTRQLTCPLVFYSNFGNFEMDPS